MINNELDLRILKLASAQHGAFTRAQVIAEGGCDAHITRRLRQGRWVRRSPGVYVLAGTPDTWRQRLSIAALAVGRDAVISHQSAAALHQLTGYPAGALVVTVAHSGYARIRGVMAHQLVDVRPEHRMESDGLLLTTPARTFVDLAAVSHRARMRIALEDALNDRTVTLPDVAGVLAAVARRGKPGVRKLGSLLDEHGPGTVPPASQLERTLFGVLHAAGLPPPVRQHPLPTVTGIAGRVDCAYPEAQLIVEGDGRRWHTRIQDLARDHTRDLEAGALGWLVVRAMHEHLVGDPDGLGRGIAATYRHRLALFSTQ